jgi:type II secretory pathway component GspD/PulD (secretin)
VRRYFKWPLRPNNGGGGGKTTLLCLLLCLFFAVPAHAQLARSFYNVTGIKIKKLSNAVQITIQTDGNISFDMETEDLLTIVSDFEVESKPVTILKFRLDGARIKVPTFNEIGTYPADSAVVTLGNTPLKQSYNVLKNTLEGDFGDNLEIRTSEDMSIIPHADVQIRFYVPIKLEYRSINRRNRGFRDPLGPREAEVRVTPDRRALQITIITDRVEMDKGAANLKRSPVAEQKHKLGILPSPKPGRFNINALHTPLSDVLDGIGSISNVSLTAQPDAAETDISLNLPSANVTDVLKMLSIGYGLSAQARTIEEGGGFVVGRGGATLVTEKVRLQNLDPSDARLLLPDFLLPLIRPDYENNALVVTASPEIVARVRADIAKLDLPRPLVRVEATAYEVTNIAEMRTALGLTYTEGSEQEKWNPNTAEFSQKLQAGQTPSFQAKLDALESRGNIRLMARPFITVASGVKGTLFAGQNRFIQVIVTNDFGVARSKALKLPVGTELIVTPIVGTGGEITLKLKPKFTTVDSIEAKTGLPTLGIRTFDSTLRLKPGDSVIVGSLEVDTKSTRNRSGAKNQEKQATSFLLVITATTNISTETQTEKNIK